MARTAPPGPEVSGKNACSNRSPTALGLGSNQRKRVLLPSLDPRSFGDGASLVKRSPVAGPHLAVGKYQHSVFDTDAIDCQATGPLVNADEFGLARLPQSMGDAKFQVAKAAPRIERARLHLGRTRAFRPRTDRRWRNAVASEKRKNKHKKKVKLHRGSVIKHVWKGIRGMALQCFFFRDMVEPRMRALPNGRPPSAVRATTLTGASSADTNAEFRTRHPRPLPPSPAETPRTIQSAHCRGGQQNRW